jgi:nucleotide sugar dehydrogenase
MRDGFFDRMEQELLVGVIGLGYIGSVITTEIALRNNLVLAYESSEVKRKRMSEEFIDINEPGLADALIPQIRSGQVSLCEDIAELDKAEVILICVGTPLNEGAADLNALDQVAVSLNKILTESKLVMIKSTVPPGTTDEFSDKLNASKLKHKVVFSPERLAEGQAFNDFRTLPIIVGGINPESTREAQNFWLDIGFDVITVSDAKTAELIKLADNCWIDLNIAFAHELAQICDAIGVDVLEVIKSANTLKKGTSYVNILTPSVGVGGYCLTKDPIFLHKYAESKGIKLKLSAAGRLVNDSSPKYLVQKLIREVQNLEQKKILILGIAFKNDSGDIRYSPAIQFMQEMKNSKISYSWYDSLVSKIDLTEEMLNCQIENLIFNHWDIVINLAAHKSDNSYNLNTLIKLFVGNGVFVDGRRFLSQAEIENLVKTGIKYIGVGRGFKVSANP